MNEALSYQTNNKTNDCFENQQDHNQIHFL